MCNKQTFRRLDKRVFENSHKAKLHSICNNPKKAENMKKLIILLVIIILSQSCKGQNSTAKKDTVYLLKKDTILLGTSPEALADAKKLESLIKVVNNLNADNKSLFNYSIKSIYFGRFKQGEIIKITPEDIKEGNFYPWTFEIIKTERKN